MTKNNPEKPRLRAPNPTAALAAVCSFGALVGVSSLLAPSAAQSESVALLAPALQSRDGAAVVVDWSKAPSAEAEAIEGLRLADGWVVEIEEIIFNRALKRSRLIEVRFNGDARHGNPPTYRVPHVDFRGVVELYQYGPSHLAALPHELVHAVLRREDIPYGLFDEEGFAAYVGYAVRPSFPGFPVYGHPLDVVVGHWTSTGHGIPLGTLRSRHRELNLKCSFQSYALRTAFYLYLGNRFGAETMRDMLGLMGTSGVYAQRRTPRILHKALTFAPIEA